MNITLEKNEGAVSGKLIVNVVKADYADKLANSLKKLKQKAQMPGFRKGMVPMSLIQKMYGTEVKADELQKILADGVNNYISDEKLRVLGEPMLSEDNEAADVAAKDDFVFKFDLAFSPEISVKLDGRTSVDYYNIEVDDETVQRQVDTFAAMGKTLKDAFPTLRLSLQNSAAALTMKNAPFELIRPGIALYGGNPFYGTDKADLGRDFEWAMSLSAPVLQVAELKKNETCSYGRTFRAAKDMHIAVVAAGYANGLPRRMSNKLSAIVNGKPARQIGRVCMGLLMLDVTERASVKAGDDAWLMGGHCSQGFAPVTPQVLADIIGTISYEVLCRIGGLNERVYD